MAGAAVSLGTVSGPLGVSFRAPGGLLGPRWLSCGLLGASWGPLGPSCGLLGAFSLEVFWGASGAVPGLSPRASSGGQPRKSIVLACCACVLLCERSEGCPDVTARSWELCLGELPTLRLALGSLGEKSFVLHRLLF